MARNRQATRSELPSIADDRPPSDLGEAGAALWQRIMAEHDIEDGAVLESLHQICLTLDRAEVLAAEVKRDGPVQRLDNGQLRDHPALKHELAARSFVVRSLQRLGLGNESGRSVRRTG